MSVVRPNATQEMTRIPKRERITLLRSVGKRSMRTEKAGQPGSIDEYIAGFRPSVRHKLEQLRKAIRAVAPNAEETIKYRMPTFVLQENLVHFAAFTQHVGFYPAPSGIAKFKDELSAYKSAKGSVQFPMDEPLPLDLIKRIVQFRVEEVHAKTVAKKRS
jgi:uncharacterized protein YdhG (YjbR/CyaY superfamily)